MSNLKVPTFQCCAKPVFDIFKAMARARALVSIFVVDEVISKGPNEELASESVG